MIPIYYSDTFLEHQTGLSHPEKPGRLTAIKKALETCDFASQLDWRSPTPLDVFSPLPCIEAVHTRDYIDQVQHLAESGGGYLDGDTPVSAQSYAVALLAVNAWLDGAQAVLDTQHPAFVLARPPGHHALPHRGMGFCLFANAAITAIAALQQPAIRRVAVLDWDVHHGNGTQAIVQDYPQIFYCSLHQFPCYPGTGRADDAGRHQNVLNIPMLPGSTSADYRQIFEETVLPCLLNVVPDLLIVSAGYDANANDPLASIELQPQDFGYFAQQCLQITPKILFGLEGGYDFPSLSASVVATLRPCLEI